MREDAKKSVATDRPAGAVRELPMPAYYYQQLLPVKGEVRSQSSEPKAVEDRKIKSLQNLSFA